MENEETTAQIKCDDIDNGIPCVGDVMLVDCPYDEDVNNTQTPAWLCVGHMNERAQDI